MTYDRGQVVRVPFPFTDRTASKNRPALVISDAATFNRPSGHLVLAMITAAKKGRAQRERRLVRALISPASRR